MKNFLLSVCLLLLLVASCGDPTTPNGYKYLNHTHLDGPKGNIGDYAYVHVYVYENGEFSRSTIEQGRPLAINIPDLSKQTEAEKGPGIANPIMDAVGLMAVGDSLSVWVQVNDEMRKRAPELANARELRYDIVLVELKNQEAYQKDLDEEREAFTEQIESLKAKEPEIAELVKQTRQQYQKGALKDRLDATPEGLKYLIVEKGEGAEADNGNKVDVHYFGVLPDGSEFDNSFKRGRPISFPLGSGSVMRGWDIGIELLRQGDKAFLFIPSELGYGKAGSGKIPGNTELIFYVELEKVSK